MRERPDYYYTQSAVIPYRRSWGKLEILMITSRKKRRWVIPKGVKEPDLSLPDSAAKEALEEAGIKGRVWDTPIGAYQYEKWGDTCSVEVFAMEVETVLDQWLESYREREWVTLPTAIERATEDKLKDIIRFFPEFLSRNLSDLGVRSEGKPV